MTSIYRNIHYTKYGFTMDDPWADTADAATAAAPRTSSGPSSPAKSTSPAPASPEKSKSPEPPASLPTSPVKAESTPASPVKSPKSSPKKSMEEVASPSSPEKKMEDLSLEDNKAPTPEPEPKSEEATMDEDETWGNASSPPADPPALAPPALAPPSFAPPPASFDDGFDDGGFGDEGGFGDDDFAAPAGGDGFDDDGFDDFGDSFAEPVASEDFGDFDDFDEGFNPPPEAAAPPPPPEVVERTWHALSLRPVPPRRELALAIQDTLGLAPQGLTDEEPRAVGGLSQVLVHESNRDAYAQLTTAPMLKPLDWTRSRVRRDHLIAMGVPVNLDEVESHRLSTLPPLKITTDLATNPPPRVSEDKHGLGPKPVLNFNKAEELCAIEDDKLKLYSLSKLEAVQRELVRATNEASALLAYLAQLKDARQQDHETYNGMISELIANAAKAKTPSSSGVFGNRHSKRLSMSGNSTPRRTGSPMTR